MYAFLNQMHLNLLSLSNTLPPHFSLSVPEKVPFSSMHIDHNAASDSTENKQQEANECDEQTKETISLTDIWKVSV